MLGESVPDKFWLGVPLKNNRIINNEKQDKFLRYFILFMFIILYILLYTHEYTFSVWNLQADD